MAVLDIRQRTGWLFLGVTVAHLILISTQVNSRRGIPLFEEVTFGTFAEVQRATTSIVGQVQDGWQNYFALQQIRRDNTALRQQLADLEIKLQQERALAAAQLQTALAEAQLQALQKQLHPHFLFNTLHTISALMHRDTEAADAMLARLSDLLRLTLERLGVQEIPLKDELEFL